MPLELVLLILMVVCFVGLVLAAKMPVSLSLVVTAIVLSVVAGQGIPFTKLVEGMFGYIDVCLVLIMAMIFMKVIEANGLLGELTRRIIVTFGRSPLVLLIALTLVIMFPGAITGSCAASVLGAGVLVFPVLTQMGMPAAVAGAVIAMSADFGMIAPPVNIPVMIIGGGIDLPYIGFDLVLALVTIPLAILTTLFIGYRHVKKEKLAAVIEENRNAEKVGGFLLFLPLFVVAILMIGPKAFPGKFPDPRLPFTFLIGSVLGLFTGKRFNPWIEAKAAVSQILPVVGILFGVGVLIEVMTLTGLRGAIVIGALSLPAALAMAGIAITLPLFGGISVYGGASVLGVPFALALLGKNPIVVLAALSVIAAMGSYMPPVALTPVVTAQLIGEPRYGRISKHCLIPAAVTVLVGVAMLIYANPIAKFLGM
jgi:GntP family gluconate:H+ symporter